MSQEERPEVKYAQYDGSWCVVSDRDDLKKGDEVIAVTQAGKRHELQIIKKVGENDYGHVYAKKWASPKTYARWTKRGEHFCLNCPDGYTEGDEIKIEKANGEIKTATLGVHIEGNLYYTSGQEARCSECGEKGQIGTPCQLCNEGFYDQ